MMTPSITLRLSETAKTVNSAPAASRSKYNGREILFFEPSHPEQVDIFDAAFASAELQVGARMTFALLLRHFPSRNNHLTGCCPVRALECELSSFGSWLLGLSGDPAWIKRDDAGWLKLIDVSIETCDQQLTPKRRLGLQRALEYLTDVNLASVTIPELTAAAGVSQRTLEYVFRDAFGLSPIGYLRLYRMYKVRRTLAQNEHPLPSVSAVARHHGIYQMGRFSSDYRRLFGEFPSETAALRSQHKGDVWQHGV